MSPGLAARLLVVVRLSSERARQAVCQDCSFAKKQESLHALLVVVHCASALDAGSRLRSAVNGPGAVKATA
jgi:hypothetical protein